MEVIKPIQIQSVLFPKQEYSVEDAIVWLIKNNLRHTKNEETNSLYIFRQVEKNEFCTYYSDILPNNIELVLFKT